MLKWLPTKNRDGENNIRQNILDINIRPVFTINYKDFEQSRTGRSYSFNETSALTECLHNKRFLQHITHFRINWFELIFVHAICPINYFVMSYYKLLCWNILSAQRHKYPQLRAVSVTYSHKLIQSIFTPYSLWLS